MGFIKTIAQGGQTWAHRVRMARQVFIIALWVSLTIAIVVTAYHGSKLPKRTYIGAYYHCKAHLLGQLDHKISVRNDYWHNQISSSSTKKWSYVEKHLLIRHTRSHYSQFVSHLINSTQKGIFSFLWVFTICNLFFFIRGQLSKRMQHLSGNKLCNPRYLATKMQLARQASPIHVGPLPLVKGTESQHIMISGGTGSGKTNCLHHVLPQIRKLHQKAVIVDTTGEFVSRYYNQDKDKLLNPFDQRHQEWHPWCECQDRFDFDAMAQSFIPQSICEKENYWRTAARSVLGSMLELQKHEKLISETSRLLLYEPLKTLCQSLQGTKAASHLDLSSEKTAGSIRSVMTSYLECLSYLDDTPSPFSIRDWVQDPQESGWLFITSTLAQRAALIPLVSTWFSIAMRSLLQMSIDPSRRLWFIVDELPSLQRLKDLETCLTESRKFGGAALLALQSPAQLDSIYGHDTTKIILGNCMTKIAFCEQDPQIAEKISQFFGKKDIREYQEGISYGAHKMRDGVSFSTQQRTKPVISPTDIQSIKKNQAYIRLPNQGIATKIKLKYKKPQKIAEPFIKK